MISQVFDMFDKDGNGEIETSELKSVLTAMGRKPDPKEMEEFYTKLDADKNGTISKKEFMDVMNEMYSVSQEKVDRKECGCVAVQQRPLPTSHLSHTW